SRFEASFNGTLCVYFKSGVKEYISRRYVHAIKKALKKNRGKRMKKFLYRSIIGILIGSFIAVVVTSSIIYFGHFPVINGEEFIKNSFGSIFCGWFFAVSSLYFELESLRLSQ